MAPKNDPWKQIGNVVKALAKHVTNEAECRHRFGVNWAKKEVYGWVKDVEKVANKTEKGSSTYVTAKFIVIHGVVKQKRLHIVSIKQVDDEERQQFLSSPPAEAVMAQEAAEANYYFDAMEINIEHDNNVDIQIDNNSETTATVLVAERAAVAALYDTTQQLQFNYEEFDLETQQQHQKINNQTVDPASIAQGVSWFEPNEMPKNVNGDVSRKEWAVLTTIGNEWTKDCSRTGLISRFDVFLQMFPPKQLVLMVQLTNHQLRKNKKEPPTTAGEIIKFIGVMVLMTKFPFRRRTTLWSTTSIHKYEPAPCFGKTGMSRDRFNDLMQCIRFSDQPDENTQQLTHERYSWRLVDDFVDNFNEWRMTNFFPGELLCIDESISRWYRVGGEWINIGLPCYVAMERKPDNGCEIQNLCCAKSGVMLRLKLVKSTEEEKAAEKESNRTQQEQEEQERLGNNNGTILHGTNVCLELVENYYWTHRVVCGDSYYASVGCAEELLKRELRFIGVVKTATRMFPMDYLNKVELLGERGERKALVHYHQNSNKPQMLAYVWLDRERRYFVISTAYGMDEGRPYFRERYRPLVDCKITPAEKVELYVPQPKACEAYYNTCSAIDQHNRCRVDTLRIDKKVKTKDWAKRVNFSILSMILVDCWYVWSKITTDIDGKPIEEQGEFYSNFATELIDNTYDDRLRSNRRQSLNGSPTGLIDPVTQEPRTGSGIHLAPTKRLRTCKDGTLTNYKAQGRCMVCKTRLSTWQCSKCVENANRDFGVKRSGWVCGIGKQQKCFSQHVEECHPGEDE